MRAIIIIIIGVVAFILFKKSKQKKEITTVPTDTDNAVTALHSPTILPPPVINQIIEPSIIEADNEISMTKSRKDELRKVCIEIYLSMRGPFARPKKFVSAMIRIQNDVEFLYVDIVFGKKKGKGLKDWINKEKFLTKRVKDQVDTDYTMKDMLTRISKNAQ